MALPQTPSHLIQRKEKKKGNFVKSCNCSQCRSTSSGTKKAHKRQGAKKFRKQGKRDPENIGKVSTGYKA